LKNQLNQSLALVNSASSEEISTLYHEMFSNKNQTSLKKIHAAVFNLGLKPSFASIEPKKESWFRFGFRLLGGSIAALYPYPTYQLAKEASDILWTLLEVEDKLTLEISREIFGITSYACAASLGIITTSAIFGNYYDFIKNFFSRFLKKSNNNSEKHCFNFKDKKQVLNNILNAGFILVALSSSIPRSEVAFDYSPNNFYKYIVVACTAIATFSNDYWAITNLKDAWLYGSTEKQKITSIFNSLAGKLANFDAATIDALFTYVTRETQESLHQCMIEEENNIGELEPSLKHDYIVSYSQYGLFSSDKQDIEKREENNLIEPNYGSINNQYSTQREEKYSAINPSKKYNFCGIM
jgi:hypothetical protein